MKNIIIFAFIALLLLSGGQSLAQCSVYPAVSGDGVYGNGADTLNVNEYFGIEIYYGSPTCPILTAWSSPFELYGSGDVTEVIYGPGPITFTEIFSQSFLPYPFWEDMDGILPDKFGIYGICMSGWPPGDPVLMFTVDLKVVGDETTEGMFCIDSADMDEDTYDWLFSSDVDFEETCWPVKYFDTIPDIMEMWPVISGDAIYGAEQDTIDLNSIFYIDIYYYNYGFTRTLWQTPFYLTGTGDVSVLSYQDIWAGPQFYDMCDEPGPMAYSYDWDGTLPDYLSIHAEGEFPGDSVSYLALRFELAIAGDETTEGTFCIDRGDPPGENHDWIFESPVPDFTQACWPVKVAHPFVCGDVNYDGGVNILDVTYLIGYIYQYWDPPHYNNSADVNNNCVINILDITYLIAYLYMDGPEPACPTQWPCRSGSDQVKDDMKNMIPIKWQNW